MLGYMDEEDKAMKFITLRSAELLGVRWSDLLCSFYVFYLGGTNEQNKV